MVGAVCDHSVSRNLSSLLWVPDDRVGFLKDSRRPWQLQCVIRILWFGSSKVGVDGRLGVDAVVAVVKGFDVVGAYEFISIRTAESAVMGDDISSRVAKKWYAEFSGDEVIGWFGCFLEVNDAKIGRRDDKVVFVYCPLSICT